MTISKYYMFYNWRAQSKNDPLIFQPFLKVFRRSWQLLLNTFKNGRKIKGLFLFWAFQLDSINSLLNSWLMSPKLPHSWLFYLFFWWKLLDCFLTCSLILGSLSRNHSTNHASVAGETQQSNCKLFALS